MPYVKVVCPHCGVRLKIKTIERLDRPITCPGCKNVFQAELHQHKPASRSWQYALGALAVCLACVGLYFGVIRPLTHGDHSGRRGDGDPINPDGTSPDGKHFALLVGVTGYEKLPPLRFTENDVTELDELLRPTGYEVTLLTTTEGKADPEHRPTGENIKRRLKQIADKCQKGDTLLLAFAGHGLQPDEKGDSFFCPEDADEANLQTMVSLRHVYQTMKESKAGARLLLVDACRNSGRRGGAPGVAGAKTQAPAGVAALFSCSENEFAYESAKLGKGHGVFFYHVLEGLKGQAKNRRGAVTWDSLNDYVKEEVAATVPELIGGGARQTPHAIANLHGQSPVLVVGEQKPRQLWTAELTNSVGIIMKRIPKGSFLMGSAEPKSRADETPQHEVEITKDFYLGSYEVTQGQWKKVMGQDNNPSYFSKNGGGFDKVKQLPDAELDTLPVENVSWVDAQQFLKKLTALPEEKSNNRKYRLPTEAEWEYACRGGAKAPAPYSFGNRITTKDANFVPRKDGGRTRPVGSYAPNDFGLYDMHGNVWEWCQDVYHAKYYAEREGKDPQGPVSTSPARVYRGGSWNEVAGQARSAQRGHVEAAKRLTTTGFRVALDPPP